jgi:hypothetical protein
VGAFEAGLEVRKQFMSAEARAFLYAYVMCPEEPQVHRDNKLSSSFALRDYVKSIRTGVVQLIETQIPKFHPRLQGAKAGSAGRPLFLVSCSPLRASYPPRTKREASGCDYQRDWRRCPPPWRRKPEGRSPLGFGLASFTFSALPLSSVPLRAVIA